MGLFDNFFSSLDGVLKEIEEGGLEKRLDGFASMIENGTQQASEAVEKFADSPEKALGFAEGKVQELGEKAQIIGEQAGKFKDSLADGQN